MQSVNDVAGQDTEHLLQTRMAHTAVHFLCQHIPDDLFCCHHSFVNLGLVDLNSCTSRPEQAKCLSNPKP